MRKMMLSVLPLLAFAAFVVAPAAAQAETKEFGTCVAKSGEKAKAPCEAGFVFTPFTEKREPVVSKNKAGTVFVLESTNKEADIECTTFEDVGKNWNVSKVGHSHLILVFEGCTGSGTLKGCTPNGNGIIEGVVTGEVTSETAVKITIESGFNVKCGTEELGNVTGTASGTQAVSSNVLKFSKATGLTFAGKASTITGEDETETFGKAKVFIN